MTPEELHDEMINRADFDDAYIEGLANAFGALSPDDMSRFMARLSSTQAAFTPEQRATLNSINLKLAQKPAFTDALRRFSEWREANAKQEAAP